MMNDDDALKNSSENKEHESVDKDVFGVVVSQESWIPLCDV